MFREWKWGPVLCTSVEIYQRLVSGVRWGGGGYFEASFTAETRLWCGKSVIFISFTVKNKKPVSLICEITPVWEKKTLSSDSLKCRFCRSDWYRFECWPPHTVKKPLNPLSIFTVGKREPSACICVFVDQSVHLEAILDILSLKTWKKNTYFFLWKWGYASKKSYRIFKTD